jgi:hypothetical protein
MPQIVLRLVKLWCVWVTTVEGIRLVRTPNSSFCRWSYIVLWWLQFYISGWTSSSLSQVTKGVKVFLNTRPLVQGSRIQGLFVQGWAAVGSTIPVNCFLYIYSTAAKLGPFTKLRAHFCRSGVNLQCCTLIFAPKCLNTVLYCTVYTNLG